MKLLFFGSSFNPPHKGHSGLLNAAIKAVSPDITLVIPTGIPPHKSCSNVQKSHRLEMAHLFAGEFLNVQVDDFELSEPQKSYTVNTVEYIKERYKPGEIFMLIGGDMLLSFTRWRDYKTLLQQVVILVAPRQQNQLASIIRAKENLQQEGGNIILLNHRVLELGSCEIRLLCSQNADCSRLLSDNIYKYINAHSLYKEQ